MTYSTIVSNVKIKFVVCIVLKFARHVTINVKFAGGVRNSFFVSSPVKIVRPLTVGDA